jgi:hypothetical protein
MIARRLSLPTLLCAAVAFTTTRADAATCASLIAADTGFTTASAVTTVYLAGTGAAQVLVEAEAPGVASQNIALVFQPTPSCQALADLLGHTAESIAPYVFLDPAQATGGLAKAVACTVAAPAPPVDVVASDVFPDTCASDFGVGTVGAISTTSTGFRDYLGPVQAMAIAVPAGSSAQSISAKAAYVVFGYGATTYSVVPWSVPSAVFTGPSTAGAVELLGAAIGLLPTKFANAAPGGSPPPQQQATSSAMAAAIASATTNVDATIGPLSYQGVVGGSQASQIRMLAYKHTGQSCGYTPGSTASSLDMINVRQGRYALWSPGHTIVNVDASGNPLSGAMTASAAVTAVVGSATAIAPNAPALSMDPGTEAVLALIMKPGYFVPWCAMQVIRTSELGALASYQPTQPCGCFYESVMGVSTSTYCHACTSNTNCNGSPRLPLRVLRGAMSARRPRTPTGRDLSPRACPPGQARAAQVRPSPERRRRSAKGGT